MHLEPFMIAFIYCFFVLPQFLTFSYEDTFPFKRLFEEKKPTQKTQITNILYILMVCRVLILHPLEKNKHSFGSCESRQAPAHTYRPFISIFIFSILRFQFFWSSKFSFLPSHSFYVLLLMLFLKPFQVENIQK